jgi:hypothetical protein
MVGKRVKKHKKRRYIQLIKRFIRKAGGFNRLKWHSISGNRTHCGIIIDRATVDVMFSIPDDDYCINCHKTFSLDYMIKTDGRR